MNARLSMLSAAIAVCVAHATALAQYPGGLNPYRPDLSFPPNWQPGPGGAPFGRTGLAGRTGFAGRPGFLGRQGPGLHIPGIGSGWFGSESGPGSISPQPGIIPPEPNVRAILDRMQKSNAAGPTTNPGAPAPISPAVLEQLANPPKVDFPKFAPANLPGAAPARQVPPAAPFRPHWGWVAAGIFVLCLLAYVLRDYAARKDAAR
jgi:hypothetical protein